MATVFSDYSFVRRLAEVVGVQAVVDLIRKNMRRNKGRLSSRDVHPVYDAQYAKMIADYPAAKTVGDVPVHYYAQFIFDDLASRHGSGGRSVLDIGCGEGNLSLALASIGYHVTGIDYDETAVFNAVRKYGRMKMTGGSARFAAMDVAGIDGRYDYIVCSDVIEHLSAAELRVMLKKCAEILKDDGSVLIHTPNGNMDVDQSKGVYLLIARLHQKIRGLYRLFFGPTPTEAELRHAYYQQVHIGVMTPREVRKILNETGFCDVRFKFRQDRPVPFGGVLAYFGISSDMGLVARRGRTR